jgi:DNA polymerase I-like protein with 3'-5' exonuclease and polymerase domains
MDFFDQLQDLNRPTVNKKPWMEAVTLTLASASDLDRIADECIAAKVYALDIETTGLDARVFTQPDGSKVTNDKIVGICIAPNEKQSYYLPIRHKDDGAAANVPPRLVRDMLLKIQAAGAVTVFHNGKFDQEFLEHDPAGAMGCWDEPAKWEDTILLAYLRDAREKRRGLKHLAKTLLEREMIELNELFPTGTKRFDFSTLDPTWEPTVWYAAADALNTLALYHKLNPEVSQKDAFGKGQATVYKIEKLCVTATRWMERCRVPMDRNTITKLIKLGQREWFDSLAELYAGIETVLGRDVRPGWFKSMQGQHHRINAPFDSDCMEPSYMEHREQVIKDLGPDPDVKVAKSVPSLTDAKVRETVQFPNTYDVTIPTEIGLLLRELGVEGLTVTEKSGQVKTSKDELNRIVEEMGDDLPFAPKIKRFREVAKGLSSNLFPVYHDLAPENSPDGRLWVGFNATKTDTGRFSTPASESGDFTGQSRWNLHSIPATYDKSKPECVRKMRTSVKANAGKILFAIDYSGVELRIVTNLSGEPKWVDEFFRCSGCEHRFEKGSCPPHFCPSCWSDKIGDLHTLTALAIYGEDAATKSDFKQKRQSAKGLNFAMCYGGGGSAAQRSVGVDKEEGWRIKRQFDKSYRGLAKWWEEQHKTARKQKYVTTAYGRKYPLPDIDHTDGGFRSKAERNSVNGPVQGCLHPDTKITTSNGLVTVRDLYHDGASFKVWTGQEWANARPLYSGHKIVCVTGFTSGNTIKTSPEHLFLTWRDQTQSPKNMGDVVEWVRQQELKIGDWVATSTEASDIAPPHLVKWAGETIYASSIYASLSKGQKSAVLRLKAGSGSRFQCAEHLNKVPDAEIPADLSKLLRYSWEKVTSSQNTDETVEMFDVEVFDDFHAFVADGCVVHNTSADIMKFAMGLIYRECKDRGWLDRAKMCVTIHDELVFEIDEDLAEEAVIVINELMTVRTVKNLGWIIPLKNDIEFGEDWTVPFNLVAMTNSRETKPEVWSERWQRVFPKFYADYLANGGTGEIKAVVEAAPVAEPIKDVPEFTVPLSSQSRHVYTIPAHRLTPELAEVLARVVSKCIGRGKEEIVIETDRGLDLLGFPFKASFAEFKIIAGYEGL